MSPSATPQEIAYQRTILQLLLAQNGSTTRLCETIAGGPIDLHLISQRITEDVPQAVRRLLPGTRFIERFTSLAGHGEVMMDNLSYIALEGLAPDLRRGLERGDVPIGHLLAQMWMRRVPLHAMRELLERLWRVVGLPDDGAARCHAVVTPDGPVMVLAEAFRRGMLQGACVF
ncbi:MAG TPA: hypothetical protein VFP68_03050 [Burkholderiaceae bacterium]|nr:hypothetical protein [Burkholderiaceae bacterium]